MILFHFTCDHSMRKIGDDAGMLLPRYHPMIGAAVVWMTHDPHASRDALGLSSHTLGCDRMFCRYEIPDPEDALPWNAIREKYRHARILEATHGTRPDLWWIARVPQRATRPVVLLDAS